MVDTRTYRVEGMTCASCVRRVEKALTAVPGVSHVAVNLATEEAVVESQGVVPEVLAKALETRGYTLRTEAEAASANPELNHALLRMVLAWVLTLPLMANMVPGVHLPLSW